MAITPFVDRRKDAMYYTENHWALQASQIEESDKSQDFSEAMADTNKKMAWFMPLMSISIAMVAPLGLALYWLMNNILMILERLILNKFIKD